MFVPDAAQSARPDVVGVTSPADMARVPKLLPRLERYVRRETVLFQRAVNADHQPFMQQRALRLQAACALLASLALRALEAGPGLWMDSAPDSVLFGGLSDPLVIVDYVGGICNELTRLSSRRGRQVDILCNHQMANLTWSRH